MSLGNGNPKEGDKGSNFNYELKVLQGLDAIATSLEQSNLGKGLFAEIENSVPITNTTTPGTLLGNGVGTLSVPANGFQVGDSFHLKMLGHLGARNGVGLRLEIMSDSVILADTGNMILPTCTNKHWELNIYFTIRAIGSATSAVIMSGGIFTYTKDASAAFEGVNFTVENNTDFDTTIPNTLDVIATWDGAHPNNNIYSEVAILQKIY
jgi:hypothetical protein